MSDYPLRAELLANEQNYIYSRKLMFKKEFETSYVGFMKDGAQWLVDNTDIKLVGKYTNQY